MPEVDWFRRAFAAEYLDLYCHRSLAAAREEITALLAALGIEAREGERALDLCCGGGRHSIALREHGFTPFGLDLSPELLAAYRASAEVPPAICRGDMRHLPFGTGTFDRVFQLFTSFGYFQDDAQNKKVLAEVTRLLRAGGSYVLDVMNKQRTIATLVPRSLDERDGVRIEQMRRYVEPTSRVEKTIHLTSADGESASWTESVRVFERIELEAWLTEAGLVPIDCLGAFDGQSFVPESAERMILVSRRRE